MGMQSKTTTKKQRYWLKQVSAADLSSGTIADYASTNGQSLKSLYQWKTKLIRFKLYQPDSVTLKSDFLPVSPSKTPYITPIVEALPAQRSGCTVTLANGTCVEFHGVLSAGTIRAILTSVSQAH